MRHASSYVCFPCRRTARAQRTVRGVWSEWYNRMDGARVDYGPDPKCPGCGNKMLSWRGKVPSGKDWDTREKDMEANYIKWKERESPFHPQHWKWKFGYSPWQAGHGLIGNPCAPKFFQALQKPIDKQV